MLNELYEFGPYRLDPATRMLWLGDEALKLTSREFDTLYVLVRGAGAPVAKETLWREVWGGTQVGDPDGNLSKQISALRAKLRTESDNQPLIKTVPNVGYILAVPVAIRQKPIDPVMATPPISPQEGVARPAPDYKPGHTRVRGIWIGVGVFAILGILIGFAVWPRQPKRLVIAVLPFRSNPDKITSAALAKMAAEMIRSELGSTRTLRMVAGEDIAHFVGEHPSLLEDSLSRNTVEQFQRAFGADYVAIGSLTRIQELPSEIRLDVNIQDTRSGELVTSESVTDSETNFFDLISRCGTLLRRRLGGAELSPTDINSLREQFPANFEATRLYVEGLAQMRSFHPQLARDLLERAADESPRSAVIHSALAEAWSALGYERRARDEGLRAFDLSHHLSRDNQLLIEGRYREFAKEGPRAIETYQALWTYFPDDIEYGLRLAKAQIGFGTEVDSKKTIAEMRKLSLPSSDDPRIDLIEAEAAENRGDFQLELEAAQKAVQKGIQRNDQLSIGDRIHEEKQRGYALNDLGRLYWERGDIARARQFLEQAMSIRTKTREDDLLAETSLQLAQINESSGELLTLAELFRKERRFDQQAMATALILECAVKSVPFDRKTATAAATELERLLSIIEDFAIRLAVRSSLAQFDAATGKVAPATTKRRSIIQDASESGYAIEEAENELLLAGFDRKDRIVRLEEVERKARSNGLIRILHQIESAKRVLP
jgi:eukaryotic-like serine/threonine-protein kinase